MKLPGLMALVLLAGPAVGLADTLEEKFQSLQDAVRNKNAADVKKLAVEVFPLARDAMAAPAPAAAEEKESWSNGIARAKSVDAYAEYALFATALQSPPATLVDLIATLEQESPKSQYLDQAYGAYLVALAQTGAAAKVPAVAEKALANFPENEDLLLVLVDSSLNRKQTDRALNFANRLVAAVGKHGKPENLTMPQWEKKKTAGLARGYWVSGVIYGERGQHMNCDKNLRAALPLIQGNNAMLGPALFYLGMANYQLGKMTLNKAKILEGAKFSQESAAIESAYADQARHNAIVMKTEAERMR